ncbi:MAG: hypothetical protein LAO05_16690 [Acidobacteriia bacterium]|nr:hypothetical protein [Terriglobia bacterium]
MWDKMLGHWDDWGHPLRPNAEDIANYQKFILHGESRLLLGTTPELLPFATQQADKVTGIDWFNMPFPKGSLDVIFGDNSMGASHPDLLKAVLPYLKPGGMFVTRQFLQNNDPRKSDNFLITKFQGWGKTFLPVQEIYDKYGDTPTTRDYDGSPEVYYFPTPQELWQLRPWDAIVFPSYEFGEYFPVVMWKG